MQFINQKIREDKKDLLTSVYEASLSRFRPVILTTVTTVSGLLPIAHMPGGDPFLKPMALAFAWGNPDSKHTFGVSAFGISGFGVDFPQETNLPVGSDGMPNPNWDPNDSNAILYPQNLMGFGNLHSE